MSEPMPLGPLHEMPRSDSKAGSGRFEWVVFFSDGHSQTMFGGRFYIPPTTEVIGIIRRDCLNSPRGQELLEKTRGRGK